MLPQARDALAGNAAGAAAQRANRPRLAVIDRDPGGWEYLERVCGRLPGLAVA
ncbi:MAG: hypothetical protein ACRDLT_12920 [Solirubrobacteraceae bacterium]